MPAVDDALRDLGRLIGLDELAFNNDGASALVFDEDFQINIMRDGDDDLYLWAFVSGFGPVTDPLILRHALAANVPGETTGGARLALQPDARQFMLCEKIRVTGMTAADLEDALHRFLGTLAYWNSAEAMPDRITPVEDPELAIEDEDAVMIRL